MATYYLARDGKQTGPFDEGEILRRIDDGVLKGNDFCWREGMVEWRPIATVLDVPIEKLSPPLIPGAPLDAVPRATPLFLHISVLRLILLSIVSFSLYEAYWIYRNWRYVKERDNLNIRPFWRGVFGVFYCHGLLHRIHEDREARSVQLPSFSPRRLASGWVVLMIISNLLSRAPGIAASIVAALVPSFLFLVPVQKYVNSVTERTSPGQSYYRWSSGHVICLVIGLIVWILLLIGLVPE